MNQSLRLLREADFSYDCNRCSRCCQQKIIRVNPYEAARLAFRLKISTSLFLKAYTTGGGSMLRPTDQQTCVFLTHEGCSVHEDRPLVCRLYPLGRGTLDDKSEEFHLVDREPLCEGTLSVDGTVSTYLAGQGAGAFIEAADRYRDLIDEILDLLEQTAAKRSMATKYATDIPDPPSVSGSIPVPPLLDMDAVLSRHCKAKGMALPGNPQEKMEMHIGLFKALLRTTAENEGIRAVPENGSMPKEKEVSLIDIDVEDIFTVLAKTVSVLGHSIGAAIDRP